MEWNKGVKVNVDACASMGMSDRFCDLLTHGSDLLLTSVPPLITSRDNYNSAFEELDAASENVDAQVWSGVLEFPASDVQLGHSLGVVKKKREPGQVGPPKVRVVVDAAASGINECIEDKPFPMPKIGDVVRCAKLGRWAALFNLNDGFYHIPVDSRVSSLLGIKHPRSNQLAVYHFLCGRKCAPFLFQLPRN